MQRYVRKSGVNIKGITKDLKLFDPTKGNKLLSFKNNFYSAHNAFNTVESVERTNERVIENLIKGLKSKLL